MARARDVAAAIIERGGPVDPLNLQKLLYYAQGWHLAWFDRPLFPERVQAWPIGPAVHDVYVTYRPYKYELIYHPENGDAERLDRREAELVSTVLEAYPERRGMVLALQTHEEDPWRKARRGLTPAQFSTREVSRADMKKYFRQVPLGIARKAPQTSNQERKLFGRAVAGDERAMTRFLESSLGTKIVKPAS